MWLLIPYFCAVKSNNRKNAVLNSTLSLMGIFTGYHITRIMKNGVSGLDSYDMLWIVIGAVFGLIWGLIVYPVNNKNFNLFQKNLLPATFIAEALYEMKKSFVFRFPNNFNSLHTMLLIMGIILYFFINAKNSKKLKNYAAVIVLSLAEFIGIAVVYNILYMIV